ncbi:YdiU family protein [Pseudonocardia sp. EV170527-09]|uniref:protein adenylyltransferase SelO n=1 Tax=Pseudonocardia sp. EV170527-09 TaxID=2603411 RepID=UPI0011F401ED|nr:YdiU family protein [Pseudonocardia sp. EV170527-09]KAA1027773.1 YdiU family protein [Pseudonocardia sp. EV170527-09]
MTAATEIAFENTFVRDLEGLFVPWQAAPTPDARLVLLNESLARELGLDPAQLRTPEGVALLTGTTVPDSATTVAQAYAGHQFGNYSPRLGDGRALLVGELVTPDGTRRDLHLKGSGRTPFARGGDGKAPLGPMLREYVISEAMHALGVPSTRSLAVVATGEPVLRDRGPEPGAVLARTAASHLRVGTFQFAAASSAGGSRSDTTTGEVDLLRRLTEYAIARHHPQASTPLELYRAVIAAQAELIARWMQIGFVHGVMNTDNMTISGETIDYGPCAFLDAHDPSTWYSSIDSGGRYAYGNQPGIAQWNLARFGESLLGLFADSQEEAVRLATEELAGFADVYRAAHDRGYLAKIGVGTPELLADLFAVIEDQKPDHTLFFRRLSEAARGDAGPVRDLLSDLAALDPWLESWRAAGPDADAMDRVNPVYVPRNHLVEEALDAAVEGDLEPVQWLLQVLADPFTEREGYERYALPAGPDAPPFRTFCGT